jgi:hypothetical protein
MCLEESIESIITHIISLLLEQVVSSNSNSENSTIPLAARRLQLQVSIKSEHPIQMSL